MIKNFNNKGIAIFITLSLLLLLSLLVIAVLLTAYNYNKICEGQIKRLKAITSVEAGVNYAYYQLRANEAAFVSDHKVPPGTAYTFPISDPVVNGLTKIEVWVEDLNPPIAGKYIVKSKATY
jgi:Tfp pilus assembly protein PilX